MNQDLQERFSGRGRRGRGRGSDRNQRFAQDSHHQYSHSGIDIAKVHRALTSHHEPIRAEESSWLSIPEVPRAEELLAAPPIEAPAPVSWDLGGDEPTWASTASVWDTKNNLGWGSSKDESWTTSTDDTWSTKPSDPPTVSSNKAKHEAEGNAPNDRQTDSNAPKIEDDKPSQEPGIRQDIDNSSREQQTEWRSNEADPQEYSGWTTTQDLNHRERKHATLETIPEDSWDRPIDPQDDSWGDAPNSWTNDNANSWYAQASDEWNEQQPERWGETTTSAVVDDAWNGESQHRDSHSDTAMDDRQLLDEDVNKLVGKWESKESYLRTHYKLLREDALRHLREAVATVRADPKMGENPRHQAIGIYDKVRVKGLTFSHRGVATRVSFSLNRLRVRVQWEVSKRLISGSLVVLIKANDPSICKVAEVASRNITDLEKQPPELHLFFHPIDDMIIDCQETYIMIEARGSLFEAQRHTLYALQKITAERFPLSKYLVDLNAEVDAPTYIKNQPVLDLSCVENSGSKEHSTVDVLHNWPRSIDTAMDESQVVALRSILTRELALIQGPPGTGKTFLSVEAIKVLLQRHQKGDPPIIIASQTNHALDQLLKLISRVEPSFARLGSRSADLDIKQTNTMYNLRQKERQKPSAHKRNAMNAMDRSQQAMRKLLEPLTKGADMIGEDLFVRLGLLTAKQAESLSNNSDGWVSAGVNPTDQTPIKNWLGNQTIRVEHEKYFEESTLPFEAPALDVEQLKDSEDAQVAGDDEEYDKLYGAIVNLEDSHTSTSREGIADSKIEEQIRKNNDLWKIKSTGRGTVYRYLVRKAKEILLGELLIEARKYKHLAKQRQIGREEEDVAICATKKFIGVTTTGLSKYRALLSALAPTTVLIEEAGETLEAPVVSACLPSLEHLILVGDHRQLRPQCHVKELEREPFNLGVSLFERLAMNDMPVDLLNRQRRMNPEIRRLLKPIYGNTIFDHESIANEAERKKTRPPVPGMGEVSTYFLTHEWQEERDEQMSFYNKQEATMIVRFVKYLIHNELNPAQITILTFYNGQRRQLRKGFSKRDEDIPGDASKIRIATVDSYQGEENEIVILSLVRSNEEGKIGFLNVDNRVCVALSRAKRGFFIFGNGQLLCGESKTWASVAMMMFWGTPEETRRRIGYTLPIKCSTHGRKTFIGDGADWTNNAGGCDIPCPEFLPCGHACGLLCHPGPHDKIHCLQPCRRIRPCGHRCGNKCADVCACPTCEEKRSNGWSSRSAHHSRSGSRDSNESEDSNETSANWTSSTPIRGNQAPVEQPLSYRSAAPLTESAYTAPGRQSAYQTGRQMATQAVRQSVNQTGHRPPTTLPRKPNDYASVVQPTKNPPPPLLRDEDFPPPGAVYSQSSKKKPPAPELARPTAQPPARRAILSDEHFPALGSSLRLKRPTAATPAPAPAAVPQPLSPRAQEQLRIENSRKLLGLFKHDKPGTSPSPPAVEERPVDELMRNRLDEENSRALFSAPLVEESFAESSSDASRKRKSKKKVVASPPSKSEAPAPAREPSLLD